MTQGWTAPGYERLAATFDTLHVDLGAGGGAFAAYVDGALVADLWAGAAKPGHDWQRDTLAVIMSATKGISALCAQILADRGQLDVDAPVAAYWPEFAQNGKESVTVRHVLTHTSGVLAFPGHEAVLGADGKGWADYDAIADGLARAAPAWPPGERLGYHAVSFGWLVNEIVRRITGNTAGGFFRANVAEPLGLDTYLGLPAGELDRVAAVTGAVTDALPRPLRAMVTRTLSNPATLSGQAMLAVKGHNVLHDPATFLAAPGMLAAEIGSSNGASTARSLARMYAMLAQQGELDGVRVVSPGSVAAFATPARTGRDVVMDDVLPPGLRRALGKPVTRSLGYQIRPAVTGRAGRRGTVPRVFGHDGAGGQVAFADPVNRVAVGFVRSGMTARQRLSNRLVEELYAAAGG